MATQAYSVFLPKLGAGPEAFEQARLVRDGFERWAFVLGPLWFLWRRLWLAALLVAVFWAAVFGLPRLLALEATAQSVIALAGLWLTGLEASSLARWTLRRRGWREAAIVVAPNAGEAERKAIEALVAGTPRPEPTQPAYPPGTTPMAPSVLGLFPEAAGGR